MAKEKAVTALYEPLYHKLCAFLPGYTWHVEWDSIGQQYIIKAKERHDDT